MTDLSALVNIPKTKAIVIIPIFMGKDNQNNRHSNNSEEARGLARAIGLDVINLFEIKLSKVRPATIVGSGKTSELAVIITSNEVEVAIFDCPLTPIQQRNLEIELRCKVLDRTAIILEIFGARARSHEGRLQVELAALEYQRPRLVKCWTHLERQRGGFGFVGGPGESQLEIDRRLTDQRISKVQSEIANIRKTRILHRSSRKRHSLPTIALVGYTNAGKSTLFNKLTKSRTVAKNMLFATLDTTMRHFSLPSGRDAILCDTVGFISNLPTELIASFRATLEEILEADLIMHVQDISSSQVSQERQTVEEIIESIAEEFPLKMIDVYNKIDSTKKNSSTLPRFPLGNRQVYVSAATGEGLDNLLSLIDFEFRNEREVVTYNVPSSNGAALAWLYNNGTVISTSSENLSCIVKVALQIEDIGRFENRFSCKQIHLI